MEHKYKVWHKKDKCWIEPKFGGDICVGQNIVIFEDFVPNTSGGYSFDKYRVFLIDEVEVYQYTGLKDKNLIEIYEGSILEGTPSGLFSTGSPSTYKVIWGVDHFHIEGTGFFLQELFNYCNNNIKVIGHIRE